jgi:hypothetical protein
MKDRKRINPMNYHPWQQFYLVSAILMAALYLLTVLIPNQYFLAFVTLVSTLVGTIAFIGLNEHSRRKPTGQRLDILINIVITLGLISTLSLCVTQFIESPEAVHQALVEGNTESLHLGYFIFMALYMLTAPFYLIFEVVLFFKIRSKWPGGKDLMQLYFIITGIFVIVIGIGLGVTDDIGRGLDTYLSIAYIPYYFLYYFIASRYCARRVKKRNLPHAR